MATKPTEAAPSEKEAVAPEGEGSGAAEKPKQKSGGGLAAWIPLIVTAVAMPVLAYATTTFVLLPKVQKALVAGGVTPVEAPAKHAPEAAKSNEKARASEGGEKAKGGAEGKASVALSKILVNLSGSMGTRYLLTSLSLEGDSADFKDRIDKSHDQLVDLAQGILSGKTISDLEKPSARNVVKNELITVFNNALGAGTVKQLYITEFAIQ